MRRSNAQRGETLIEGMCALAVFTVGMLGVLSMNTLATRQNSLGLHETQASNIAHDVVDAFSRLPYDHPAFAASSLAPTDPRFTDYTESDTLHTLAEATVDGDGTNRPLLGAAHEITSADNATGFNVYWRAAADTDSSGVEQGKVIAVFVTYPIGKSGVRKTVVLWTYKYNPDTVIAPGSNIEEI